MENDFDFGMVFSKRRDAAGLSRRVLAERCGLSERFLAHVERGSGNISVVRLDAIARALGTTAGALLDGGNEEREHSLIVSLIGLRGAGKSTVGPKIAATLGVSPRTVQNHRAHICAKLELRGSNRLLEFAIENRERLGSE